VPLTSGLVVAHIFHFFSLKLPSLKEISGAYCWIIHKLRKQANAQNPLEKYFSS